MATEWFYQINENVLGPMPPTEIRRLIQKGRIAPDTLVRKGNEGDWLRADRVGGLFDDEGSAAAAPAGPAASAPPGAPGRRQVLLLWALLLPPTAAAIVRRGSLAVDLVVFGCAAAALWMVLHFARAAAQVLLGAARDLDAIRKKLDEGS